jgi:uncharacterized membrane protein YgcG
MRPGQLGTLIHERARSLDVTATIIDLAVRGFLRIEKVGSKNWRLVKLTRPSGRAGRQQIYEARLNDAIFRRGRKKVLLSTSVTSPDAAPDSSTSLSSDAAYSSGSSGLSGLGGGGYSGGGGGGGSW